MEKTERDLLVAEILGRLETLTTFSEAEKKSLSNAADWLRDLILEPLSEDEAATMDAINQEYVEAELDNGDGDLLRNLLDRSPIAWKREEIEEWKDEMESED